MAPMVLKWTATDRIVLRRMRDSDANDLYDHVSHRAVSRWTANLPHPFPKDRALKWIRHTQRTWRSKKQFFFGIYLSETGNLIGGIGLAPIDWQNKNADLGYWLAEKYWARGLTSEAIRLILPFGFNRLKLHCVYATAFEPNTGSIRVLEKCGFKKEGCQRHALYRFKQWHNALSFGLLQSEFKPLKNGR